MIRIGTRSSKLALAQAGEVSALLKKAHPGIEIELVHIRSSGDRDSATPLEELGGTGAFTKALEDELLKGMIDIAVHSAKDLPARMTAGLEIAAVPLRASPRDAWLSSRGMRIRDLEPGAVVGTGSPRRRSQLFWLRRDLIVRNIRGNIDTRVRKLASGEYDALIMAEAGLVRCGLEEHIAETLDPADFLPAAGQGALAVQVRVGDGRFASLCAAIDHRFSHRCMLLEKEVLARLGAGCSAAVGVLAREEKDVLHLSAVILDREGKIRLFVHREATETVEDLTLAEEVASELFARGAAGVMRDA
jgi:hydroxymethylbilane synthase